MKNNFQNIAESINKNICLFCNNKFYNSNCYLNHKFYFIDINRICYYVYRLNDEFTQIKIWFFDQGLWGDPCDFRLEINLENCKISFIKGFKGLRLRNNPSINFNLPKHLNLDFLNLLLEKIHNNKNFL